MFQRPQHVVFVTAALFGILSTTVPAQAPSKLGLDKVQTMKDWGYSIQTIKGWNSIPTKSDDKSVVGHWKMNLDELRQRGDYSSWIADQHCELSIVRISTQPTTLGEEPKPDSGAKDHPGIKLSPQLEKRLNPKSIEDYIEGQFDGASKRWTRKPLKGSKTPGELLEFGANATAITVGFFKKDNVEWAVIYASFEENYKKTWQDIYLKSIQTFSLIDQSNTTIATAARKDPTKLKGEEKRAALKAGIASNPGWYAIDTPYYVFLSNSKNRPLVESLAKDIEKVRDSVYTKLFPQRNTEESISPVRVLDTETEYYQYGGPGGSAGFFSPDSGELVLFTKFEDVTKTTSEKYCRSVMFHEAFHQYVHYAIGDVSPHSWFNEGHGDYFAGISISSGSVSFKTFDWRVNFLKQHLREKKDLIPLRTLVRLPQNEYYNNAGLKYSEGWAFIYYLRSVNKSKRYQGILDTYFTYLADNVEAFRKKKKEKEGKEGGGERVPGIPGLHLVSFEDQEKVQNILSEAVDKAFEGVDFEELDKEFKAWVEKL